MGSADFFLLVVLPFIVAGAIDGVGIGVNVPLVATAGAATGVVFFLFFFVLMAVGGAAIMGGRAKGTMVMTSILLPAVSAMWDASSSKVRGAVEALAAMAEAAATLPSALER